MKIQTVSDEIAELQELAGSVAGKVDQARTHVLHGRLSPASMREMAGGALTEAQPLLEDLQHRLEVLHQHVANRGGDILHAAS